MIIYRFFSSQQGQTATDLAKEHGNKEIISLLENPHKVKEVSLFYQDSETRPTTSLSFPHFSFKHFS